MGYINTTFLGKEYSIPEDVLIYIDLLDFTDSVQKQLASAFVRKLRNEIAKDNIGLLGDEALAAEIEQQVGKFIAKLCDNGIFTRTISDYLKNNKGYQLYSQVNKAALEKMKSLLIQEMDAWQAGYEDAINKAESHVTGMGFSIWSSSFVNHAIYAAMEASTLNKQSKEAESQYQRDMKDLSSRLDSKYGGEKSNYINNTYIPNMEAALTVFAYELLDKYVADLIANGKFDGKTLDYVDIGRSNDLLKNLTLSNNKKAILENAFAACPYNIAVYMQAMKYDLLDYDSFQTAKVFKQDHHVLSFFRESWGEVSFPTKFNINYYCINAWASLTGKSSADLLRGLTEQYAIGIVKAYSRVADIMADKSACRKIIGELREDAILSGASICVGKAREYVQPIVNTSIWEQLTEKCGHTDLLSRIKKYFPSIEELHSKEDFDSSITEQLAASFEEGRKELAEQIEARRAEDERQRIEHERIKAEQDRITAEKKAQRKATTRKIAKRIGVVVGIIAAVFVALIIAVVIYLFATDKPIDNDFANREVHELHNLTYYVPDNWEYSADESSEKEKLYARYDNWGNLLGLMSVLYEGDSPDISRQNVVSEFEDASKSSKTQTKTIGKQSFDIVTFTLDSNDGTPFFCNVYITEQDQSVFYVVFSFVEESNIVSVYEEIIAEIAFDEYVNPKESTYNEAIGLMSAEKYDEAISIFTELDGYKDSAEMIVQCQNAIRNNMLENAKQLIEKGNYYDAIDVLEKLGEHGDSMEQLKIAQYGYANSLFNDGKYNDAATIFKGLGTYENSIEMFNQSQYAYAVSLMNSQSYDDAIALFDELSNYAPAKEKSSECKYILALDCIDALDYDGAKDYLNQILDYKDAAKYKSLLDNIVSDIYYNDEYRSMAFIWVVSRINTSNCSSELIIYTGQDNAPWDDDYVVDFSTSVWYEWKKTNSQYYLTATGVQDDSYYIITLNGQSLTEQFNSSDGTNKGTDTYHILSDEYSESLKENWLQYFHDDEYGYWDYDEWIFAEATVE